MIKALPNHVQWFGNSAKKKNPIPTAHISRVKSVGIITVASAVLRAYVHAMCPIVPNVPISASKSSSVPEGQRQTEIAGITVANVRTEAVQTTIVSVESVLEIFFTKTLFPPHMTAEQSTTTIPTFSSANPGRTIKSIPKNYSTPATQFHGFTQKK